MVEFKATLLAGGETLELVMYDFIGEDWFEAGITDKLVQKALSDAPKASLIRLRMNSPGGDAFMGFTIANLLRSHSARKEADIEGLCASIATAIAMTCDEIRMWPGSQMMIHEAEGGIRGRAKVLRSKAELLEGLNLEIAAEYVRRTGRTDAEVRAWMDAETWMRPEKALELKFADKIMKANANATALATMRAGLKRFDYRNVPPELSAPLEEPSTKPLEDTMNRKVIALALGISESATDDEFETAIARVAGERKDSRTQLAKLEALTGKTGDEAHGVLLAWKQSHEELPKASTELATLKTEKSNLELDGAIAVAKQESRHTPAREEKVRALLKDEDVSLAGAKAMVAEWGKVDAIAAAKDGAQAGTAAGATGSAAATAVMKHNGKSYAEMTSAERKQLHDEDEELFTAMRKQAHDAGLV